MELPRQISNPCINVRFTKVFSEVCENFFKDGQTTIFPLNLSSAMTESYLLKLSKKFN